MLRRLIPAGALLLTACLADPLPPPSVPPPALDRTRITFAVPPDAESTYRALLPAFHVRYPEIEVTLQSTGALPEHIVRQADLALLDRAAVSDPVLAASLLDLNPLIDADATFARTDIQSAAWVTANHATRGLMRDVAYPRFLIAPDRWDARLLPVLPQPFRWRDLWECFASLDGSLSQDEMPAVVLSSADVVDMIIDTAGDTALTDPIAPRVTPELEHVARALQQGIIILADTPTAASPEEARRAILWSSRAQMEPPPDIVVESVQAPPSISLVETPLPTYVISRGTFHPDAAWKLLAFLSEQPIRASEDTALLMPARQSVARTLGVAPQTDALATRYPPPDETTRLLLQAVRALADGHSLQETVAALNAPPVPAMAEQGESFVVAAAPTAPSDRRVSLTVRIGESGYEAIQRLATTFNDTQDDIRVQVHIEDAPGTADCFALQSTDDRAATPLLDLRPLIDADASFPYTDYPPALLHLFEQEGSIIALPDKVTLRHIAYNHSLLATLDMPEPAPEWTIAQLLEMAQQAKHETPPGHGVYVVDPLDLIDMLLDGTQTSIVTESGMPAFTDPSVVQTLHQAVTLLQTMPAPRITFHSSQARMDEAGYERYVQGEGLFRVVYGGALVGGHSHGKNDGYPHQHRRAE